MSLYDDLVAILKEEIGPSAPILLDRYCKKHLGIRPAEITTDHLVPLADVCCTGIRGSLGDIVAERVRRGITDLDHAPRGSDRR